MPDVTLAVQAFQRARTNSIGGIQDRRGKYKKYIAAKSWIEEEQRILQAMQHGRRRSTITRETVGKMTGMEIMRAVRCGDLPNGPMAKTLNYMIIEVEPGRAVVQGNPTQDVLNVQGLGTRWLVSSHHGRRAGQRHPTPCCPPAKATGRWI